jgi:hypothetical protein
MDKTQTLQEEKELARLDLEIANNKLLQDILIEEQAPLKSIYEWSAPERVFSAKSRNWYVAVATIAMLFIVYSALTGNLVLIFLIISLTLVAYSLYSIPPQKAKHKLTNKGINAFNNLYLWRNILHFWVTKRGHEHLINLEFKEKPNDLYYQRMILLVGEGSLRTIVGHLIRHVDYLNSNQGSFISKFIEGEYLPLLKIISLDEIAEAEEDKSTSPITKK